MERAGLGTHQWDLPASVLVKDSFLKVGQNDTSLRLPKAYCQLQPLIVLVNIVPLVNLFPKLSFFILFLQIFNPKPALRWSIYIGALVTTAFYISVTIGLFALSTPPPGVSLAQQFVTFLGEETTGVMDATLAVGYFNIFSDFYILLLPISGVIRLQLPKRRKIGVILIFMTGLL